MVAAAQAHRMARIPIVFGQTPLQQVSVVADTQGKVMGLILQNVSTVDIYVSEDANRLQQVSPSGVPTVGLHFPADSTPPWQLVIPEYNGKLYGRAQGAGGAMEAILYERCPTASPVSSVAVA